MDEEVFNMSVRRFLKELGVTAQPQVRFWRVLDTPDKVGWGA